MWTIERKRKKPAWGGYRYPPTIQSELAGVQGRSWMNGSDDFCAFQRDFSAKPETDESHLVRDQDCMADGIGAPNQELRYDFVLSSMFVWSRIVIQQQNARSEKPRPLFPNPAA
ncbi:hypothetical protein TNCV_4479121 [Trichonephila clavipes]|nr:hypothetical protein TNCV_4479121 [Trichonephila clavipes]